MGHTQAAGDLPPGTALGTQTAGQRAGQVGGDLGQVPPAPAEHLEDGWRWLPIQDLLPRSAPVALTLQGPGTAGHHALLGGHLVRRGGDIFQGAAHADSCPGGSRPAKLSLPYPATGVADQTPPPGLHSRS